MKEGLLGAALGASSRSEREEARSHVARWFDLSRRRLDVCLLDEHGQLLAETAVPPDDERRAVRARHARRARLGGAGRRRAEGLGLAPLACKTDRIDARVLAVLCQRDLVPAIWLPDPSIRRERELARFRVHLVRHRTTLERGSRSL